MRCPSVMVLSGLGRRGRYWSLGKWHLWDAVRILEAGNQPVARLLRQNLQFDPLTRLRDSLWGPGALHRPACVSNRHRRTQEPHVNFGDRERTPREDERESRSELAFDLRATSPPLADDVHDIAIFGEQLGISPSVMLIPRCGLPCLHLTNRSFVFLLVRGREGECQHQGPDDETDSGVKLLHHLPPGKSSPPAVWTVPVRSRFSLIPHAA